MLVRWLLIGTVCAFATVARAQNVQVQGKGIIGALGTPGAPLQVVGNASDLSDLPSIRLDDLSANPGARNWALSNDGYLVPWGAFGIVTSNARGGDPTGNAGSATLRLVIDASGRVGIGKSNPSDLLDVNGSIDAYGAISADVSKWVPGSSWISLGTPGNNVGIAMATGTGSAANGSLARWDTYLDRASGSYIINQNGVAARALFDTAGNITLNGNVYTNGCRLGVSNACGSDARYKLDIRPLARGALAKLVGLRPVSFTYDVSKFPDRGFSAQRSVGLVAQDVEKVAPELVDTDRFGYRTVKYGADLSMLAIQAIKEQQEQIAALQRKVEALEAKLAR